MNNHGNNTIEIALIVSVISNFIMLAVILWLSRKTHVINFKWSPFAFVISGTFEKEKTLRFNRILSRRNRDLQDENKKLSLLVVFFILIAVFVQLLKDKAKIQKNEPTDIDINSLQNYQINKP